MDGCSANRARRGSSTESSSLRPGNNSTDEAGIILEEYTQLLRRWCDGCESPPPLVSSHATNSDGSEREPDYTYAFTLPDLVEVLVDLERPAGLQKSESRLLAATADVFETLSSSNPVGGDREAGALVEKCGPLFDFALAVEGTGTERRQFRERSVEEPGILDHVCDEVSAVLEQLNEALHKQCPSESVTLDPNTVTRLGRAYNVLLEAMHTKDIARHEAVGLEGIASLLFSDLLHKPIHGTDDIMSIYSDHMSTLVSPSSELGDLAGGPLLTTRPTGHHRAPRRAESRSSFQAAVLQV